MNLSSRLSNFPKLLFLIFIKARRYLPKKRSHTFGFVNNSEQPRIEHIYVINLDRQPARWAEIKKELRSMLDWTGDYLLNLAERFSAVDAKNFIQEPCKDADIDPEYTLGDQLFVEPQPSTFPTRIDLDSPIQMSRPEVAVARSHINVWRKMAISNYEYALIVEDDIWIRRSLSRQLDKAWGEIMAEGNGKSKFDILYLSYQEVKHGAPKTFLSVNVFRPVRGLWHLSGYVISREGAIKLLHRLPCCGPIDLWINHQFDFLEVQAVKRSVISQRRDFSSTNSYSILPTLTKIGAITSESASLFHIRPNERPVFAYGPKDSDLSSLAMALSMLGYRCCSDLQTLPDYERKMLLSGAVERVFDAYVNIQSLEKEALTLSNHYPKAKFIITTNFNEDSDKYLLNIIEDLNEADILFLPKEAPNKWQIICEHLRCAPPTSSFPRVVDLGQRKLVSETDVLKKAKSCEIPKRDKSPWIVESRPLWQGIHTVSREKGLNQPTIPVNIHDSLSFLDKKYWMARNDTFTDNLALFRPSNIEFLPDLGAALLIRKENLDVRKYSAASLTSHDQYLFGKFEVILKVSDVPGVVTGFFLHRDSPRQEIDIEIVGNRPNRLLVNVFYNPGNEGVKYDYGYRGSASYIELGFDASEADHLYTIEWNPNEIRWFVDNRLVHRRVGWDPTPIPHLPMSLHTNIWPSRSKDLAGRLASKRLPTTTFVKSLALEANRYQ